MYLFVYYYYIGIIILPYLQPTEIVISSIHIIPYVIMATAAMLIIYEIQMPFEALLDTITAKIKNPLLKLLFWFLSWIPIGLLSFTPWILTAIPNKNVLLIISLIIVVITWIYLLRKGKLIELQNHSVRLSITFFITSLVMTGSFAFHESKDRLSGKCNIFKIITKDSTFEDSESRIYYGKTNNYTIIYVKSDSTNFIIPNNTIILETVKQFCESN